MMIGAWQDGLLNLFSSANLQMLLLVGSGILAIALLSLALTRWGHSRPVRKCVILSFVAHILLMGFAYGTRLIGPTAPAAREDNPIRVNLVDDKGESLKGLEALEASEKPWEQFVNQQALPTVDKLERPKIDSEVVIERIIDRQRSKPKPSDVPTSLATLPQKSADKNQFLDVALETNNELPMKRAELTPPELNPPRRGDDDQSVDDLPGLKSSRKMARLDIPNEFKPSSSAPGQNTMEPSKEKIPFVSDMVDSQATLPKAPVSPPNSMSAPEFAGVRGQNPQTSGDGGKPVSNPRRIGDGQPLPKIYSLRGANNRLATARKRGGSVRTERAVELALRWLANNQAENGSWDPRKSGAGNETKVFGHDRNGAGVQAENGITALASLAFLAAGHSHLEGGYQTEVRKSLEYLIGSQHSNGDLSGDARLFAKMYCHSMSLLALSEALAMTGDKRLHSVVQRGVNFTVAAQNGRDGGWRYQPGDPGDMSQFGWQVLALHSARLGGAVVPEKTMERMESFLQSCSSGVGGGLASYRPNQGPTTTMTAEALICRYFLKQNVAPMTVMEAARKISTELPTPHHVNLYYWYYGTLAMYHAGGSDWELWNTELKKTLLPLQNRQGEEAGSWPANGLWGGYGGKVYSTAMATLNLEVYYRYLPVFQELAAAKRAPNGFRQTSRR